MTWSRSFASRLPDAAVLGALCCLATGAMAAAATSAETAASVVKCESCHGKDGNSTASDVPRLNGQQPQYLASRIRSFADPTRQNVHAIRFMWGRGERLSNAEVAGLADYFSAQPASANLPSGARAELGRKIYQGAGASQGSACQDCHGVRAEGKGPVPRLSGQHARYLQLQLESFSLSSRVHGTMIPHTRTLSQDQIEALVAYLAKD